MSEKILYRGAEAVLIQENGKIIKRRISKSYRLKEIDEKLRKQRTRIEAKILEKLQNKINVPKIIKVDEQNKEIIMQFIEGKKLSDNLDSFPLSRQEKICEEIGKEVAKIHDLDIIHGDLTTSNMILVENSKKTQKETYNKPITTQNSHNKASKIFGDLITEQSNKQNLISNNNKETKIFFIDFGLSFHSKRVEDKAVDLHLLKQALESKHFLHFHKLFKAVLSGYETNEKEKILKQLEKVEKRGRYK